MAVSQLKFITKEATDRIWLASGLPTPDLGYGNIP